MVGLLSKKKFLSCFQTEPVEDECESSLDSLPNLDKLGSNVYDSCVVPVTLKVNTFISLPSVILL